MHFDSSKKLLSGDYADVEYILRVCINFFGPFVDYCQKQQLNMHPKIV
jgi:hypothetical protein